MNQENIPRSRKTITKKLSTGQKITLTPHDDRILKNIYDYISGYAKRKAIETALDIVKKEVIAHGNAIPTQTKIQMQLQRGASFDYPIENISLGSDIIKSENDILLDKYYQSKTEQTKLEDTLKLHSLTDHKICYRDLEGVLKSLNEPLNKKQIEQMIWEVDENCDELIDYDEFQLTYYRNLTDTSGNEPNLFFRLLEFMIFDGQHKGYMIEDDCMELLYARYGGGNLEKEMTILFGNKLRAEGGDGSLNLTQYLESRLTRTGRRALVT